MLPQGWGGARVALLLEDGRRSGQAQGQTGPQRQRAGVVDRPPRPSVPPGQAAPSPPLPSAALRALVSFSVHAAQRAADEH